ncbi:MULTISPECIES: HAD family hydrolase [unclassified Campylobacter]|uniref:HAD family hydrolase n=1 Tax=unclassified Campylobacter TaxID=2593542 RepID=UPI001472D1FE|nr:MULTISPECIES: HAD family hydrolase [unclassified Campylobacter]
MKKTILFDLDGTLIDSTSAILTGFDTAFKVHNNQKPDQDAVKSLVGHPLDVMFGGLGVDKDLIQNYIDAYKACYKQIYLDQTTLLDFAKEAVELASKIADVGVVTTKTSKFSVNLLEYLGIKEFIKTVVGRDDVVHPKPNPEPINLALKNLGKDNEQNKKFAFMIGDTCMDMMAAKSAGIEGLALLCGYQDLQNLKKCSSHIFENPLRAVEFIAKL